MPFGTRRTSTRGVRCSPSDGRRRRTSPCSPRTCSGSAGITDWDRLRGRAAETDGQATHEELDVVARLDAPGARSTALTRRGVVVENPPVTGIMPSSSGCGHSRRRGRGSRRGTWSAFRPGVDKQRPRSYCPVAQEMNFRARCADGASANNISYAQVHPSWGRRPKQGL